MTSPGDLLPANTYDDWAAAPRKRFLETVTTLRLLLAAAYVGEGRPDSAKIHLETVLDCEPTED